MTPEISIAMATYNGEKYLREQLDSILAQTYTDWELIICDDCSADSTVHVLNEYAESDNRIKIIVNDKNLGYAQNFLKAMSLCTGEWIFFCDQDDIWNPNKIERFLSVIQRTQNANMIISDFLEFPNVRPSKHYFLHLKRKIIPLSFKKTAQVCSFPGMAMCINKKLVPEIMGNNVLNNIAHDWKISLIAANKGNCYFLNETTAMHRIHENNTSGIRFEGNSKQDIYNYRLKTIDIRLKHFEPAVEIPGLKKQNARILYYFIKFYKLRKRMLTEKSSFKILKNISYAILISVIFPYSIVALLQILHDIQISLFWKIRKSML